jgi:hypothetical protein
MAPKIRTRSLLWKTAALVLFSIHDQRALPLLDDAIQLRERSGADAASYLRDLKLRCNMEAMQSAALQLQSCAMQKRRRDQLKFLVLTRRDCQDEVCFRWMKSAC